MKVYTLADPATPAPLAGQTIWIDHGTQGAPVWVQGIAGAIVGGAGTPVGMTPAARLVSLRDTYRDVRVGLVDGGRPFTDHELIEEDDKARVKRWVEVTVPDGLAGMFSRFRFACASDEARARAAPQASAMTAAEWNRQHPIGTPVWFWPMERRGEGRLSRTRSAAWMIGQSREHEGHASVLVEDYSGGIALTHVEPTAPTFATAFAALIGIHHD